MTSDLGVGKVRRTVGRNWKRSIDRGRACILGAALLLGPAALAGEPAPAKSVLVLYGYDPFMPAMVTFDAQLRAVLLRKDPPDLILHNEVLDLAALTDPSLAEKQNAWFKARYGIDPPAAVLVVGDAALAYALGQRSQLWPDVPLVYAGVDEHVVAGKRLPPGVTGVARRPAIAETLEMALRMLPDTRRVVFVGGTSPMDLFSEAMARPDLARVTAGLEQIDLTGLTLAETADRLAALPEHTIAFGVAFFRDATGRSMRGSEAVQVLSRRSQAPLFSVYGTVVGLGVVGGYVTEFPELGQRTGELMQQVLDRREAALPAPVIQPARPVVDGRQLDRWDIPDSRLPPGTEIRFREPSLWHKYRGTAAAVLGVLGVESLLITFLLVERRRRRAAEAEARANQERIAHINRVGTIAELSGSLAHELNGPLGAIVNNARAARKLLLHEPPDFPELRASLVDIEGSAERAGQVIRRLRSVLRKDEFRPTRVEVPAVVHDAVRLVHSEAARRRVTVEAALPPGLPAVKGDEVLLLQLLLNLLLNALDALAEQPPGNRHITVQAAEHQGTVEIAVSDSGAGIPESALPAVFEPFFTTKTQGLGMGLAICRSIAEAHGGRIAAENRPGGGARFRVTLPAAAVDREAAA